MLMDYWESLGNNLSVCTGVYLLLLLTVLLYILTLWHTILTPPLNVECIGNGWCISELRDCNMLRVSVTPFAKLDLFPLLEFGELPPHKGVVVGVDISCDERPSPVNLRTQHHHHHNQ